MEEKVRIFRSGQITIKMQNDPFVLLSTKPCLLCLIEASSVHTFSILLKLYLKKLLSLSHSSLSLQADLKERYSVNELLADLAGCRATRVLLFVDQSYSGVLSKRLRGSQKHLNVVLIQNQAWQIHNHQRLNSGWEDSSWSYISPATCLLDHLGKVLYHMNHLLLVLLSRYLTSSFTNDVIRLLGCLACWSHGLAF